MNLQPRTLLNLSIGLLTTLVLGLCLLAWSSNLRGAFTIYDLFPLLGMFAFSLMALQYIGGSLKRGLGLADEKQPLRRYVQITGYFVLVLILLHPGLLYFGLWRDGLGLPPFSVWLVYPQAAAQAAILMGSVALTAFLLYELRHWFRDRDWWKYIEYASIAAMVLIFVNSLMLGGDLIGGWFRYVWILLGWVTAFCIVYNLRFDRMQRGEST